MTFASHHLRRSIASLTLAAFVFSGLIPFFAIYHVPDAEQVREMSSLFGEKVLICTADGFRLMSWKDLQSDRPQPKQHPDYQCAMCYVSTHHIKSFLPATTEIHAHGMWAYHIAYGAYDYLPLVPHLQSPHPSRAPPISLIS